MKLEVGMYVRFKDKRGNHYIRKITSVNTKYPDKRFAGVYIDKEANNVTGVSLKNIIKASHNIIDLIEVGDIIQWKTKYNYGINEVINRFGEIGVYAIEEDCCVQLKELSILKILIKEQFENNCYKVGD